MKRGVVLASAPGALEELALAPKGIDVLAVNAAGVVYLEPVAVWGSVHGDQLYDWVQERISLGGNVPEHIFGETFLPGSERQTVHYYGPVLWAGSSALYVVQWALQNGYERLALAGVHMEGTLRDRGKGIHEGDGMAYDTYQKGWIKARPRIEGKVRSYGGWTKEFLGEPDEEFWAWTSTRT